MMYAILGLAFVALYFVIRSGAKAEVKKELAEAKVEAITKTIKEANEIDKLVTDLTDDELDNRLRGNNTD